MSSRAPRNKPAPEREPRKSDVVPKRSDREIFDDFMREAARSFDADMARAFREWCSFYCAFDLEKAARLHTLLKQLSLAYGAPFLFSFYLMGVRWDELTLDQFCIILETLDRKAARSFTSCDDNVERIKARQNGAAAASHLMTLFLQHDFTKDPARANFLSEILIEEGKPLAQNFCFVLKNHHYSEAFARPALDLVRIGHIVIAHEFWKACERWELDRFQAIRLVANLISLLNAKDGVEKCLHLLQASIPDMVTNNGTIIH